MKTNFLFPNRVRVIGWILLFPSIVLGYMAIFHGFEVSFLNIKTLCLLPVDWGAGLHVTPPPFRLWEIGDDNFTGEAAGILVIISAVFVAFSKEKKEDEYIAKIRLESLLWATYIAFAIQIFCLLFFYGVRFFESMVVNLFTILFVFIARYYFIIYRSKFQRNEE